MMQAAEYRLKADAALAAANDTDVDAFKRDYQDNAKLWLQLAELAEWQESMRLKGHLPDQSALDRAYAPYFKDHS